MQQTTPPPCLFHSQRSVLKLSICISDEETESSNFDSLMPITAASDNLAIFLSSSILGNKLLTLRWIKNEAL